MLNQEKTTHSSQGLLDWKCCSCQSYVQILLQKIQCYPHLKWQPGHCIHFQVPEKCIKKNAILNSQVIYPCGLCDGHMPVCCFLQSAMCPLVLGALFLFCTKQSLSRVRQSKRARQTIA